jgi:hypothetical protein
MTTPPEPSALDALTRRRAELLAEVAETAGELEETGRLLEDTRRRQRLPVLEALRVSSPCRADWTRMAGDDRVRHCDDCKQYVYNLSAMTQAEALELIESLERAPCVRYYERPDGTILFRDCAVTRSQRRGRRLLAAGAVLAVGAGLAALAELPPPDDAQEQMGVPVAVLGGLWSEPSGPADPDDAAAPDDALGAELAEEELAARRAAAERALPEAEQRVLAVEQAEAVLGGRR